MTVGEGRVHPGQVCQSIKNTERKRQREGEGEREPDAFVFPPTGHFKKPRP